MMQIPAPTKQREEGWAYWADVLDGYGRRLLAFVSEYGHWKLLLRVDRGTSTDFITAVQGQDPSGGPAPAQQNHSQACAPEMAEAFQLADRKG